MRTLTIDGKEFSVAENFNELSKEQLLCFAADFYLQLPRFFWLNDQNEQEPISEDCYNALLYTQLLNILQIDLELFDKFSGEDVVFLLDEMKLIHFLLEESTLTINHFPQINDLHGPENDFGDMDGEEFMWAEKFYIEFKQTKDIQKLNALIACLYRPADAENKKLPFILKEVEENEKRVAGIDITIKTAILFFFEGCRNELPQLYPAVFEGKKQKDGDFNEVLLQVAKDGPFGDFYSVLRTNIHLIYKELNRVRKEAIEMKRNMQ
ncbi:MAG TPA: hypothetical protein PLS10_07095 [Chitinophagales bacterium]|nr:hypothetical protein [Chitinophagales bacterium]